MKVFVSYARADQARAEWAAAFTRTDADGRPVLIPVPIDDAPPEPLLASVIRSRPLHRLRPEEAAAELLRAVDPEHHPPFPSSTRLPDHLQHVLDLAEEKPCRDRAADALGHAPEERPDAHRSGAAALAAYGLVADAELALFREDVAEIDDVPFRDKVLQECAQVLRKHAATEVPEPPCTVEPPPVAPATGDAVLRRHLEAAEGLLASDDDQARTELHRVPRGADRRARRGGHGRRGEDPGGGRPHRPDVHARVGARRPPPARRPAARRAREPGQDGRHAPDLPGRRAAHTPEQRATATDQVYATWARHYLRQRRIGAARDMIEKTHGRRLRGALFTELAAAARARRDPQTLADYHEAVSLVDLAALRALAHIDRAAFLEVVDTELLPPVSVPPAP